MLKLLITLQTPFAKKIQNEVFYQISQLESHDEFHETLYTHATNEQDENIQLQLYTWAADLGNEHAISYLHLHQAHMCVLVAEKLDKSTYDFFKERENTSHNSYSLYMLGLINNVCNNPDYWYGKKPDRVSSNRQMAIDYYNKAIVKNNPLAMISLAYLYHDTDLSDDEYEDKSDEIKHLAKRTNELNFSLEKHPYLQQYL